MGCGLFTFCGDSQTLTLVTGTTYVDCSDGDNVRVAGLQLDQTLTGRNRDYGPGKKES